MRRSILSMLAAAALLFALDSTASAAAPEFLFRAPDAGTPDSGAGEVNNPRGIAASPTTGHIYVSDLKNARIDEFTAWGSFVKAWGWDVAPDGAPGDTASDQLEVCTTICKAGTPGSGAGQVNQPIGIALDAAGNVYVYELANLRVQKFDPEGHFLAMFGGEPDAHRL